MLSNVLKVIRQESSEQQTVIRMQMCLITESMLILLYKVIHSIINRHSVLSLLHAQHYIFSSSVQTQHPSKTQ